MKKRSHLIFLQDILNAIEKISRYTDNLTYETFIKSDIIQDAVIRNIEVIGEAANKISADIREKYPAIPWKRMVGLRNIVIHEYFGIDLGIIWEIIKRNLPETRTLIEKIINKIKENI